MTAGASLALRGRVVSGDAVWEEGTVLIEGGVIRAVEPGRLPADRTVELPDSYLVPGFVDLQVNGAFGVDVVSRPGRLGELSDALPATGVTSYLPTLVTLPLDSYPDLLAQLPPRGGPGAQPLGLHLEGPFISPEKKGAHAAEAVAGPDPRALEELLDATKVGLLTLAPELPGAGALIELAAERGAVVSLGHSAATFEEATAAFDRGASSVTHLFNAMSLLHHRDPGLPGAALSHPAARCGIIADGRHVHPEMFRLAFERLGAGRMYLVTDAMAAAGMGPGEYELAGRTVYLRDGVPRLGDGTIAGSVLTMAEAVQNAVQFTGCTLPAAVRMAATTPAELLGAGRKGRLAAGCDADVVALSPGLEVEAVWARGEPVHRRELARDTAQPACLPQPASAPVPLDTMGIAELLRTMNNADARVAPAVGRAIPHLEPVVESAREALAAGGRVVYVGAGTSGRIAVADAAECSPTFGVEPGSFVGVMAGGTGALAAESAAAEDDAEEGHRVVSELGVDARDLVIGVSASGSTPFTLAAQRAAGERGARTACVVNTAGSEMAAAADHPVELPTGPEVLAGSTRLKAGTAQKLALNMISTATLAGLGYVYGDLMVGMVPGNRKLTERAQGVVARISSCEPAQAREALESTGYDVRTAVLLLDGVPSAAKARRLLAEARGSLRLARELASRGSTSAGPR